jgi:hypothetical protein
VWRITIRTSKQSTYLCQRWNPQNSTILQQHPFVEPCRRVSARIVKPTFLLIFRKSNWLIYFCPSLACIVDDRARFETTSGLHWQVEEHHTRRLKPGLPFLRFHRHITLADTPDHSFPEIQAQFFFSTPGVTEPSYGKCLGISFLRQDKAMQFFLFKCPKKF